MTVFKLRGFNPWYLSLLLISGCSLFQTDNTPPPAPLVEFTPSLTLTTLWRARTLAHLDERQLQMSPVVYQQQIIIAAPNGYIQVFDFKNGKLLWTTETELEITAGAGVDESTILIGSRNGQVAALSLTEGTMRWQTQVSSEILSAPQSHQGVVVVRTVDGKLWGLSSQTGEQLWVYERDMPILSLRGTSKPLIIDRFVIAGFDNGKIAVLEHATGKLLWETPIAIPRGRSELERMVDIDADPILRDDVLYVSSYSKRTVALALRQGSLLWERDLGTPIGLAVDNKAVYLSGGQSHLWALERTSGNALWKQEKLHGREISAPAVIANYVVVGDAEGYLHWLQQDSGQFAARYRFGRTPLLGHLQVQDNVLIAANRQGELIALQPQ
ncbi:MAG: outer membrane protein assembly factor BamB [Pseudomonadota bacterium]|nr:outer membrane protein assembly factor BamB [Pseudomonadota bacterium]